MCSPILGRGPLSRPSSSYRLLELARPALRLLPAAPSTRVSGLGARGLSRRALPLAGCSPYGAWDASSPSANQMHDRDSSQGGDNSKTPFQVPNTFTRRIQQSSTVTVAVIDGHSPFRECRELPLAFVARKDHRAIAVQRITVVRVAVVALVLVALGVGTAIGLAVGSKSSPPTKSTAHGASTSSVPASTSTSLPTSTTTTSEPAVLSCGPAPTPSVRPTMLTVGCATRAVTVTAITWNTWGAETGGQGTGIINEGFETAPAVVVVFHVVNGIFQDIAVTPTKDASSTPPTTSKPTGRAATTSTILPTTTTTIGGIAPVAASQPGSGWGGN